MQPWTQWDAARSISLMLSLPSFGLAILRIPTIRPASASPCSANHGNHPRPSAPKSDGWLHPLVHMEVSISGGTPKWRAYKVPPFKETSIWPERSRTYFSWVTFGPQKWFVVGHSADKLSRNEVFGGKKSGWFKHVFVLFLERWSPKDLYCSVQGDWKQQKSKRAQICPDAAVKSWHQASHLHWDVRRPRITHRSRYQLSNSSWKGWCWLDWHVFAMQYSAKCLLLIVFLFQGWPCQGDRNITIGCRCFLSCWAMLKYVWMGHFIIPPTEAHHEKYECVWKWGYLKIAILVWKIPHSGFDWIYGYPVVILIWNRYPVFRGTMTGPQKMWVFRMRVTPSSGESRHGAFWA